MYILYNTVRETTLYMYILYNTVRETVTSCSKYTCSLPHSIVQNIHVVSLTVLYKIHHSVVIQHLVSDRRLSLISKENVYNH
jgi:hypothetical protein